jgi:tetratricopeptide (TPR) repeat protein
MVRSLILFLSILLCVHFGYSQVEKKKPVKCDCSSTRVQDSLVEKYFDNGAQKIPGMYNNPSWQLYCDSIIALCPNIAYAYRQKGIPYIKNGEYEKTFSLYEKMVELDPKAWTAYRGFCKCIFTKDYEGAIIDFQKAQQLLPNGFEMDHSYLFYEGLCNLELGNYSKAEENLKQDISIQTKGNPSNTEDIHFNTLLYVGILYYEMKENEKAKDYLLKCLNRYKELPDANYYLALVYGREGNAELKNKYLQIAKETKSQGYGTNEDNVYYAYYPHQITLYEIEKELHK